MAKITNNYYETPGIREICHAVKSSTKSIRNNAIQVITDYLISTELIDRSSVLIPAPQHYGYADYTKEICEKIAKITDCKVCDVLKCVPHQSIYNQKQDGLKPTVQYYLSGNIEHGKLYFVDNVIATGMSFHEANKLFGYELIPFVYAIDERKKENEKFFQVLY